MVARSSRNQDVRVQASRRPWCPTCAGELHFWRRSRLADDILEKLKGGDRRSIGRADEVVTDVLNDPALFTVLFGGMLSDDPLIRMPAADAVEKITVEHPEYLQPHKVELLEEVAKVEQQEVRWHVAQMIARLGLSAEEFGQAAEILREYLEDKSKIVKVWSMQALADLMKQDETLLDEVVATLEEQTRIGSPAMQSRGRRLLARLRKQYGLDT